MVSVDVFTPSALSLVISPLTLLHWYLIGPLAVASHDIVAVVFSYSTTDAGCLTTVASSIATKWGMCSNNQHYSLVVSTMVTVASA